MIRATHKTIIICFPQTNRYICIRKVSAQFQIHVAINGSLWLLNTMKNSSCRYDRTLLFALLLKPSMIHALMQYSAINLITQTFVIRLWRQKIHKPDNETLRPGWLSGKVSVDMRRTVSEWSWNGRLLSNLEAVM